MEINTLVSVIDIGSNSVRVLVASIDNDHKLIRHFSNLNTTRLYQDISDGQLSISSMERTANAIEAFVQQSISKGVEDCFLFATAAVRVAGNRQVFMDMVKDLTGYEIDVIDEQREALLAFAGVGDNGLCGIIDIGGASSEIAIGNEGRVLLSDSMKLGAVKCKEILKADTDNDIIEKISELLVVDKYLNLQQQSKQYRDIKWYGVGGTITTMGAMLAELKEYNSDIINKTCIKYKDVINAISSIKAMSVNNRKSVIGLDERRTDIIVFGLSILAKIMMDFGIDSLMSSDNGNMVGYILLKYKGVH